MALVSYGSLEAAIKGCFGEDVRIEDNRYVSGGDINDAFCLFLSSNRKVFVKSNSIKNADFFDAEEKGLAAIAATGTIKTPKLFSKGVDRVRGISFLMMEMIDAGRGSEDSMRAFGHELSAMHSADTSPFVNPGMFGFVRDNYIGASKQINTQKDTWTGFFRQCRLEPQLNAAERYFDKDMIRAAVRLLDRLDDLLVEPDHPSLIHGDLWSGNYLIDAQGSAVLIDPAAYVGHAEADIAMTELFGRFSDRFYDAYREKKPMQEGYSDRRQIYNLYHLTNHLNLFGAGYLHSVTSTIRRYAG